LPTPEEIRLTLYAGTSKAAFISLASVRAVASQAI
jgi:hypothetical protein